VRCRLPLIVLVVGLALAPLPALADVVVPSADVTTGAEIVEIEGVGLELRCTRNDKLSVRRIYADGAELLKEAEIERFDLEADGWTNARPANSMRRC
jgi:hypothetical protein